MRIKLPPVQANLLSLIHGTHQQPNTNGKKFDVRQGNANVASDNKALIEDPIEDVNQVGGSGDGRHSFHSQGLPRFTTANQSLVKERR
jgi:hypothetical protein